MLALLSNEADGGYVSEPFSMLNQIAIPHDVAAPTDAADLGAVAQNVFEAVQNRQWGVVASLGVVLTIVLARKFVPEESKAGAWLHSQMGGIFTNFALSFGGALGTALVAGQPFSSLLVFKALNVALSAAGIWAVFKNSKEARETKKAQAAGVVASKNPDDTLNK